MPAATKARPSSSRPAAQTPASHPTSAPAAGNDVPTKLLIRDKRIDRIGFVGELKDNYAEDLRKAVKLTMNEKDASRAEGDFFEALMVPAGTSRVIDPAKFLKLYEAGQIDKKEFLSAIAVGITAAGKFLSPKVLDKISDDNPTNAKLIVKRKPDVEFTLIDAVEGVRAAIAGG